MAKTAKGILVLTDVEDSNGDLKRLIGKRIKKVRSRLGHTAKWVAVKMGVSRSAISQIETGLIHINAVSLYKLASVLKCTVQEFFPAVPNSSSLTEMDVAMFSQEDAQAAEFLKKAFKKKKS